MMTKRASGRLMLAAVMSAMSMVAVGCHTTEPRPAPAAEPAPAVSGCKSYRPAAGANMAVTQMAFPTGEVATSAVLLSVVTPQEVRAGQPYTYQLHVTNLTSGTLQSVNVSASQAQNFDVTTSKPEATRSGGGFNWNLGNLASCETRVIEVTGRADAVGTSANCLSVSYNNLLCTAVRVTQPALAITKTAPSEVLICDPIPLVLEVKNTGTGVASNVVVRDQLPAGLVTTDGKSTVEQAIGNLNPGEAKRVTIQAKANKTGSYQNTGTAAAEGNLTANSNTTTTVVRQPVLAIACAAPERIFLGRNATFTFTVRNTGDAASANTVVTVPMAAGATFVSATEGGAPSAGGVSWNLGTLAAGASRQVAMTVTPAGIETMSLTATAQGVCAAPVTANCVTAIEGIPAVLLEVVDLVDPVEVGGQTTYVITATNQGSATLENLSISAELPSGQDFVSAAGATTGSAAGKKVTFVALPTLAPKAKAEWRIVIKANAEGDQRILVNLSTRRFAKPIEETESTNQYK